MIIVRKQNKDDIVRFLWWWRGGWLTLGIREVDWGRPITSDMRQNSYLKPIPIFTRNDGFIMRPVKEHRFRISNIDFKGLLIVYLGTVHILIHSKRVTALCGNLFGATCALYNNLGDGMLYSLGHKPDLCLTLFFPLPVISIARRHFLKIAVEQCYDRFRY